jgi:hypothetical protein
MCKNQIEDKCCGKECASKKEAKDAIKEAPIHFDMKRMQEALAGETIMMPSGLTREEKRQFMLKQAKDFK